VERVCLNLSEMKNLLGFSRSSDVKNATNDTVLTGEALNVGNVTMKIFLLEGIMLTDGTPGLFDPPVGVTSDNILSMSGAGKFGLGISMPGDTTGGGGTWTAFYDTILGLPKIVVKSEVGAGMTGKKFRVVIMTLG